MLRRLPSIIAAIVHRGRFEREMADEMRFHIEAYAADLVRSGLSRDDALRRARIEFGPVESLKEDTRQASGLRFVDELRQDLRYAGRQMRKAPGFTAVAVLTVALGVGANTAIFGVVDAVMIKKLPVPHPHQLVFLSAVDADGNRYGGPPYPWFDRIRARAASFDGMAMFAVDHSPLTIDGQPEQVLAQVASGSYFATLGVRPLLGRTLTAEDERLAPAVAVLGYRYWQRRFGGRDDVLGRVVQFGTTKVTIVGVTPRDFDGTQVGQPIDITVPITLVGFDLLRDAGAWWASTVARVKSDVSIERAHAEAAGVFASLEAEAAPATRTPTTRRLELVAASRGSDRLRRQFASPLVLLAGAVAAVLLIGCANIANLLLVRASARRREMAMRTALGAGRARLVRQLLTESMLLFLLGAAAGGFVAYGIQRMLGGYLATGRNPIELSLSFDARVVGFAALLTLACGILSGLAPALRAGHGIEIGDLRLAGKASGHVSRLSRSLVVVQVAVSIVVLVSGALVVRTLDNLRSTDTGFRADGVVTLSIRPLGGYDDDRRRQTWSEIVRRVEGIPGVESASLSILTPLSGRNRTRRLALAGFDARPPSDRDVIVNYVSPGFFETMGMPIADGRDFAASDDAHAPKVVMLNAAAATYYFGPRAVVGATIGFAEATPGAAYRIVGVPGDARYRNLRDDAPRVVYQPLAQVPDLPERVSLAIRTRASLAATLEAVRHEVRSVGADILISDVETLRQQVDRALLTERVVSMLGSVFGVLGLFLAALGLYGVAAYTVLCRTPEIGIRMALGASAADVRWLMLRQSLSMAALGVAVGVPLSLSVATLMRRLLYNVSPSDPAVIAACVALLLGVTALAAYLPARRASRIAPVRALMMS